MISHKKRKPVSCINNKKKRKINKKTRQKTKPPIRLIRKYSRLQKGGVEVRKLCRTTRC